MVRLLPLTALSRFFLYCFTKLKSWGKYYIQPCKSVIFVSGLAVTHKYVNYAVVDVLITFFTDGSHKEPIVHAAALTNLGEGISAITLLLMTATSTFHSCHLKVIICSTLAYVVGLLMLYLNAYHVNVFNMIPTAIYYSNIVVVIMLIYVGKIGSKPILDNFFKGQLWFHWKPEENKGETERAWLWHGCDKVEKKYNRMKGQFQVWRVVAWLLALVPIMVTADFDWPPLLLIASLMLAASCVLFWCGAFFYHPIPPMINPLSVVIRVFWGAFSNINAQYPENHDLFFDDSVSSLAHDKLFYTNNKNELCVLPSIKIFRWVDKAAIQGHTIGVEEQVRKCRTLTRVQETKHVLKMFPIWLCFLGFSVARATWKIFFVEQADDISDGRAISVTTLLLINTVAKESISYLWDFASQRLISTIRKQYIFLKCRICLGMFLGSICLVVAWYVASKKLKTTWILVPQFCLSGFAEGLALDGLALFYNFRVPESMRGYGDVTNEVVNGTGHLLSIVLLYILRSRFFVGEEIGSIHLDKYYLTIAGISFISFLAGSLVLFAKYAYNRDLAETGYLDSGEFFMNDASDQEKRLHAQVVELGGGDPDAYKDAALQDTGT